MVSMPRLTDFHTMVHNWWVDFAKEWKFNSSVPHSQSCGLAARQSEYFTASCGLSLGPTNLKSSLCRLEGNEFWAFVIHPLPITLRVVFWDSMHANMKVSCSFNRSWPARIYSAQEQWWSRYGIVLKYNLCWARKLHCKLILILFSLLSIIMKMSVIKGKFNFR